MQLGPTIEQLLDPLLKICYHWLVPVYIFCEWRDVISFGTTVINISYTARIYQCTRLDSKAHITPGGLSPPQFNFRLKLYDIFAVYILGYERPDQR